MTRSEFMEFLIEHNINKDLICFDNEIHDDAFCIRNQGNRWIVFYFERGAEFHHHHSFSSESDALIYLMQKMM